MKKLATLTAAAALAAVMGLSGAAKAEVFYAFDGSLIGYWHYDTNSGNNDAVDDSSNSNDGDLVGTATRDGVILPPVANNTNSLLLDGSGAMAIPGSVTTPLDMSPDYTVAAWFNTSSSAQIDIYGGSNQLGSAHNNLLEIKSGVLRFLHRQPAANSGGINLFSGGGFADGAWHHVAGVKDGADLILYVDGSAVDNTSSAPDFSTNIAVVVGQQTNAISTRRFIGNIDEVRIYDTALSADEIALLFSGVLVVTIDIKPGSDPNSINQGSGGVIPVAILGSETFDATTVDGSTCTLGDAGVKVVGKSDKLLCSVEDVNDDGFDDLVCKFVTIDLGATEGETTATIHCTDPSIEGTDSIRIVPPE